MPQPPLAGLDPQVLVDATARPTALRLFGPEAPAP